MPAPVRAGRALLVAAAGFLCLDGVLLLAAGVWSGRRAHLVWGVVLLVLGVLVAMSWRWYRTRLEEIEAARTSLRRETEALRDLLRR